MNESRNFSRQISESKTLGNESGLQQTVGNESGLQQTEELLNDCQSAPSDPSAAITAKYKSRRVRKNLESKEFIAVKEQIRKASYSNSMESSHSIAVSPSSPNSDAFAMSFTENSTGFSKPAKSFPDTGTYFSSTFQASNILGNVKKSSSFGSSARREHTSPIPIPITLPSKPKFEFAPSPSDMNSLMDKLRSVAIERNSNSVSNEPSKEGFITEESRAEAGDVLTGLEETFVDSRFANIFQGFEESSSSRTLSGSDPRLELLRSASIFNERPDIWVTLNSCIDFEQVEPETIIQKEKEPIVKVCWVVSGTLSVTQNVQFVRVGDEPLASAVMRPFTPFHTLNSNETVIDDPVFVQELVVGDWFPYFPGFTDDSSKEDLMNILKNTNCDCTITSKTRAMIASIPVEYLIASVSLPVIQLLAKNSIFRWDREFLIEELLQEYQGHEKRKKFQKSSKEDDLQISVI